MYTIIFKIQFDISNPVSLDVPCPILFCNINSILETKHGSRCLKMTMLKQ